MAAPNAAPIFSKVAVIQGVVPSAVCTKSDGVGTIGTDIFKAFTADATNGSYVQKVRLNAIVTAATATGGLATNATTARIFISSITSGATTAADTFLWQEIALPIVTADHNTASCNFYEVPLNFALPPSYTILVTYHMAPASNTNWRFTVIAGNY
jgi:hypothetical protein